MERKAYSPKEVAELLGVSTASVYRMIRRGLLRAVTLGFTEGSSYRIPKDAVDAFLKGGEQDGADGSRITG